jgi:hypothetical protein
MPISKARLAPCGLLEGFRWFYAGCREMGANQAVRDEKPHDEVDPPITGASDRLHFHDDRPPCDGEQYGRADEYGM